MVEPPSIRSIADVSIDDLAEVGGKAAGLGEIVRAGCRVPPGFVVSRDWRALWGAGVLDATFERRIHMCCVEVGARYFAVRSSAIVEDGSSASWAGQFQTYLGIKADDVPARIYDCWRSPASLHATAYAEVHGAEEERWDMAVIVQAMIPSVISGVLFTIDPVSTRPNVSSLEAIVGLGELLVQGQVTPQSYVIDRMTGEILESRSHRQRHALRLTDDGIISVDVPPDYALPLSDLSIAELMELGLKLEKHFGSPQDIEWAYADDSVFIVQSRPITAFSVATS